MANVQSQQQILVRLTAVTVADIAFVTGIAVDAIREGALLGYAAFGRKEHPVSFWSALALIVIAGIVFAAAVGYAVLLL